MTETTPLLLPIRDAARQLGVSRSTFYTLLREGAVGTVTIGRRRLVPASALEEYVAGRWS